MSGTGQSASAQLISTPPLVSFGGTAVGGHLSGAATFRNVGGAPLTINAVKLPTRRSERRECRRSAARSQPAAR